MRDAVKLTDPFLPTRRQQASGKWRQEWRQARRNAAFNPTPNRAPNPNPNPYTQNPKPKTPQMGFRPKPRSVRQKQAPACERPGATRSVQVESHKTQGASTAHLKAFQCRAASRMALNRTLGNATLTMQRSRGGNHSAP